MPKTQREQHERKILDAIRSIRVGLSEKTILGMKKVKQDYDDQTVSTDEVPYDKEQAKKVIAKFLEIKKETQNPN